MCGSWMKLPALLLAVAVALPGGSVLADPLDNQLAVFTGTVAVGENGDCQHNGQASVSGNGLRFPFLGDGKEGSKPYGPFQVETGKEFWFELATTVVSTVNGTGSLVVCGRVTPGELGIGAACGWSQIDDGRGKAAFAAVTYKLHAISGVAVGGTIPIDGLYHRVDSSKARQSLGGSLHGLVQAQGGAPCVESKPSAGATSFSVVGAFQTLEV